MYWIHTKLESGLEATKIKNTCFPHRIIDSLPQILKWKIIKLKPDLLTPQAQSTKTGKLEREYLADQDFCSSLVTFDFQNPKG